MITFSFQNFWSQEKGHPKEQTSASPFQRITPAISKRKQRRKKQHSALNLGHTIPVNVHAKPQNIKVSES